MTCSPAAKGASGVSVTVWSPLEKPNVPSTGPLQRPKAPKLAALTDTCETG